MHFKTSIRRLIIATCLMIIVVIVFLNQREYCSSLLPQYNGDTLQTLILQLTANPAALE